MALFAPGSFQIEQATPTCLITHCNESARLYDGMATSNQVREPLSKDLNEILEDWDYDEEGIAARWIQGNDGHPKIQLRVNLGVLQMEVKGRPDGKQPEGHCTLLNYYKKMEEEDLEPALVLGVEACSELQQEALQFYYRYLAFYALQYLDGVIDDTHHNLELLDLVSEYAQEDELAWQFLQFFPYVRMMNARARAEKIMLDEDYDAAGKIVQEALEEIREFLRDYEELAEVEGSQEIEILDDLLQRIRAKRPRSKEEQLREELSVAIKTENYEHAASLRDALKKLETKLVTMQEQERQP